MNVICIILENDPKLKDKMFSILFDKELPRHLVLQHCP